MSVVEPGQNGYPGQKGQRGDHGLNGPNVSDKKWKFFLQNYYNICIYLL